MTAILWFFGVIWGIVILIQFYDWAYNKGFSDAWDNAEEIYETNESDFELPLEDIPTLNRQDNNFY